MQVQVQVQGEERVARAMLLAPVAVSVLAGLRREAVSFPGGPRCQCMYRGR